jgi:radical SAM superfamily enzyme
MADIFDRLAPTSTKTPEALSGDLFDFVHERAPRPDNVYEFVARDLAERWKEFDDRGVERPPAAALAAPLIEKYRTLAGLEPYPDAMDRFRELRHTPSGGLLRPWEYSIPRALTTNYGESIGGFTMLMAKGLDAVTGRTENKRAEQWSTVLDQWRETYGINPEFEWRERFGGVLASTALSLQLMGGGAFAAKAGVSKAATLKAAVPGSVGFGMSSAGATFHQVAQRRRQGQTISPAQEWAAATWAGIAEATGNIFGWAAARGVASRIFAAAPQLARIASTEGGAGIARAATRFARSAVGAALRGVPAGASEELAVGLMQVTGLKVLGITPELGFWDGVKQIGMQALMGGMQPALRGAPMAAIGGIQTRRARAQYRDSLKAVTVADLAIMRDLAQANDAVPDWVVADINFELAQRTTTGAPEITAADSAVSGAMMEGATDGPITGSMNVNLQAADGIEGQTFAADVNAASAGVIDADTLLSGQPAQGDVLDTQRLVSQYDGELAGLPERSEYSRVVWGVRPGDSIELARLSELGYEESGQGAHVSADTEYWANRLSQDYGRDPAEAQVIHIRPQAGDVVLPDVQYAMDPEGGVRADSGVLATSRTTLQHGIDWRFADEQWAAPPPVPGPLAPDVSPTGQFATSLQTTTMLSPRAWQAVNEVGAISDNPAGASVTTPFATYEQGSKALDRGNRNVWIRQSPDQDNSGRVLLVQWSSDLLSRTDPGNIQDQYGEMLYSRRPGYARADDFWELPQWIAGAAHNFPNADVYVVRDPNEFAKFLQEAGYGQVAFSVLDVNKPFVRRVIDEYSGNIVIGGYADMADLQRPHVTQHRTIEDWVNASDLVYTDGTDYRHFAATLVMPRLCLSEGCLSSCAFCAVVPQRRVVPSTTASIQAQLQSFADLDYQLVYVNDKTFGQADTSALLPRLYWQLKDQNANFQGFVVQTSAAALHNLDTDFLIRSGIRYVEIGVESYNDAILRRHRKPATTALIDEGIAKLREAGIAVIPNIMVGLPGENATSYENTADFIRNNRDIISHLNTYNLAVYAGTELSDVLQARSDADVNENQVQKSFHENPQDHQAAWEVFHRLGMELLQSPEPGAATPSQREARVGPIPRGFTRDPSAWASIYMLEGAEPGMWHATSDITAVMGEGLKSAAELGRAALGPGAGAALDATVSVTYDEAHAYNIAERMTLAVLAARSDISRETPLFADELAYGKPLRPSDVVHSILDDVGFVDDTPRTIAEIFGATGVEREGRVFDDWDAFDAWIDREFEGATYDALVRLDDALPEIFTETYETPPVRVGFTMPASAMARIDPDRIGVVRVAAREGAPGEVIAEESEIRFDPIDVHVIAQDHEIDVRGVESDQSILQDPALEASNPVTEANENMPPNPLTDGVKGFLTDETGAIPADQIVSAVTGVASHVTTELDTHGKVIWATVLDEGSVLRNSSELGAYAHEVFQEATNRARTVAARHESAWNAELNAIPLLRRGEVLRWMRALREDGQTNFATLVEHPARLADAAVPPEARSLAGIAREAQDALGDWAVDLRAPQVQRVLQEDGSYEWGLRPFRKAVGGRYYHIFTAAGMDMFEYQTGPLFEALLDWHAADPTRNPHLPAERNAAREVLRQRAELKGDMMVEGAPARSGSLEFVRVFTELPVALTVNGRQIEILRRDPLQWFHTSLHQQSRALALREVAQDQLLQRYGEWNDDLGMHQFPLGNPDLGMTDLSGLIDRLRMDVSRAARGDRQRRANHSFNRTLDNYRRVQSGIDWFSDYYPVGEAPGILNTAGRAVHSGAITSALSMAFLWDFFHWTAASAIVGPRAAATGFWHGISDILRHPRQFDAEYRALGVVPSTFTDWSLNRHTLWDDLLVKSFRNLLMAPQRFTERRKQYLVAAQFDTWLRALNDQDGLRPHQIELLKRLSRLTDDQVLEIARGEMSPQTRTKALQNATSSIVGLTEASINRAWIQNNPAGRVLVPFMSVVTATTRTGTAIAEGVRNQLRIASDRNLPASVRQTAALGAVSAGTTLLAYAASILGRGWVQRYFRRAVMGQPLVDPDDPEKWYAILGQALAEGGIFGPFYRLFEAGKYANWNASRYAAQLFFPIGLIAEIGSALIGQGRYAGTPWARRLRDLGATRMPMYRMARNWWDRLMYPMRQDYQTTRKLVRKWEKDQGRTFPYGEPGRRNFYYYRVFEAIRDGDDDALSQAIATYKDWAKEQGWDAERARNGLRSSLDTRRPINLSGADRQAFLDSLTPEQRDTALALDSYYRARRDRITRRPGIPPRPPRAPGAPRPPQGGNWYAAEH